MESKGIHKKKEWKMQKRKKYSVKSNWPKASPGSVQGRIKGDKGII